MKNHAPFGAFLVGEDATLDNKEPVKMGKHGVVSQDELEKLDAPEEFPPANDYVTAAKSHHPATATLPGGDKYTKGRVWTKRILAILVAAAFIYLVVNVFMTFNIGGVIHTPDAPTVEQAQADFQTHATAPNYDTLKYISDTSAGQPFEVSNVKVGRVVSGTGEGATFTCEATAEVKFENSSVNSTSTMRMKYSYNAILGSWSAGEVTAETNNYRPNDGPDLDKVEDDLMSIMAEYDQDSADAMDGCDIERSDDEVSKDGGEVTFTCTKPGGGSALSQSSGTYQYSHSSTNGYFDLVKKCTVRIEWSEIEGWQARIVWMSTQGDYETKTNTNSSTTTSTDTTTSAGTTNTYGTGTTYGDTTTNSTTIYDSTTAGTTTDITTNGTTTDTTTNTTTTTGQ